MSNKATHSGSCQVCGRGQKLPGGKLSRHGYTVDWGFFNGICPGSDHLPFEQDISLIEGAIRSAQAQIDALSNESSALKAGKLTDDNKAWFHVYVGATSPIEHKRTGGYYWQQVQIVREENNSYVAWFYIPESGKRNRLEVYRYDRPSLDAVRIDLNTKYAARFLNKRVEQLRSYVAWQEARIKGWKPSALTLIK